MYKENPTIAFTSGDFIGPNCVCLHFLEKHADQYNKVVVTVCHPHRAENLQHAGAELRQITKDENSMIEAFRGVDCVILFPQPEEDRVKKTCMMMDAMKKAEVKMVIMMSVDGAEDSELRGLADFKEIEDKMKQICNDWVICRITFAQNCFHLWAPYVSEKGKFPMTLSKECEFPPVCLSDVSSALHEILQGGLERHRGQLYVFTGPENVKPTKIVDELNKVLHGHGRKVEYQEVSREKLEQYFRSLREEQGEDRKHFEGQPTDCQIMTMLDEMEYIKKGNSRRTDHLKKLIGSDGEKIANFFRQHEREFRPIR